MSLRIGRAQRRLMCAVNQLRPAQIKRTAEAWEKRAVLSQD